ncbi:MAG: hypothetical protein JZD41_09520 [Thermoproteus sp.]|nr:hypothetical protein [Thermoproteus sp.]
MEAKRSFSGLLEHELDALRLLSPPPYVVGKGKIVAKNLDRTRGEIYHGGRWRDVEFYLLTK